jgi:hypothetical protein
MKHLASAGHNLHCLTSLFTVEGKTVPNKSELWDGQVYSSWMLWEGLLQPAE